MEDSATAASAVKDATESVILVAGESFKAQSIIVDDVPLKRSMAIIDGALFTVSSVIVDMI